MKSNRRNRKRSDDAVPFPTPMKGRWNPADNTRAQVFADKRAVARKSACRGKITQDFA